VQRVRNYVEQPFGAYRIVSDGERRVTIYSRAASLR
jgi:hypothetical protein